MQREHGLRLVSAGQTPAERENYRPAAFRFTGSAREYFRIWVVNTALSLLTLGFYSAWAKVRAKQYFYRNTVLDGSSFDYAGSARAILRGRIAAALALGTLFLVSHFSIGWQIVAIALTALVTPWVLVSSLAFSAENTVYRNIRFQFAGRVREACWVCAKAAVLYVVSCGLAHPYVVFSLTRYAVTRYRWGDARFDWSGSCSRYFGAHLFALCLTVPMYAVLFALAVWMREHGVPGELSGTLLPWLVLFYAYLLVPAAFLRARLQNLLYGGMQVGEHFVVADFRAGELLRLYVTNTLAIVASFGLLIPWAQVRAAVYRASCLTLQLRGELVAKVAPPSEWRAIGDGFADLGDFEIGVGT
jgi:uncharacterized membrane protein YjgN (DUF898 family)